MFTKVDESAARHWQGDTLEALKKFVCLHAKSPNFDAQWEEHGLLLEACNDAAAWGKERFPEGTFEVISEAGRTPCLFVDIPGTRTDTDKSALFYGHLDKQPEAQGWTGNRKPFEPVIENNRLYGRGCADDGYSIYSALTALVSMREAGLAFPHTYAIIETAEESASPDFVYWLGKLAPRCKNVGLITVLDGGIGDYERLWATTSFRGLIAATLTVEVLRNGMHSGNASGVVPDSFMIARSLLDRFENSVTGEILDTTFNAQIPADRLDQLAKTAQILADYEKTDYPWKDATHARFSSTYGTMLAQTWKPQLAVIGAAGLPAISDAGNVLRAGTSLRLSIRIPAHVDAAAAVRSLTERLTANPPFDATVSVTDVSGDDGWDAAPEQDWFMKAFDASSQELFGKPAAFLADGASIPILKNFEDAFPGAQFFVSGVLGPYSNAHGPDEMLDLAYVTKLTGAVARILAALK